MIRDRTDRFLSGNDYLLQLSQFEQLYRMGAADDSYDLPMLTDFRASRFNQSIANNPYFFNGPFPGVLVQPAAYTFIYRFMANKSAEYPEGRLDGNVLKSFFSITGEPGNFKYTVGALSGRPFRYATISDMLLPSLDMSVFQTTGTLVTNSMRTLSPTSSST